MKTVHTLNSVYRIDPERRRFCLVSSENLTEHHAALGIGVWHRGFAERGNLPDGGYRYFLSFTHEDHGPILTSRVVSEQDELSLPL